MYQQQFPGYAVQQRMNPVERALWIFASMVTLGLAYPFYRHRLNRLRRTTRYYR